MEGVNNSSEENIIARSESDHTLSVVQPDEKLELSPEKKAEIPQKIKEAEEKYQKEIVCIEEKYKESIRGKTVSKRPEEETIIDEKIKTLGLQRTKESYDSRISFLNSLK